MHCSCITTPCTRTTPPPAMRTPPDPDPSGRLDNPTSSGSARAPLLLLGLAALALGALLLTFLNRSPAPSPSPTVRAGSPEKDAPGPPASQASPITEARGFARSGSRSPEQVVADRLAVFARKRRDAATLLAQRRGVRIPDEVLRFFGAVESRDWLQTRALYQALHARRQNDTDPHAADLEAVWPAVLANGKMRVR